MLRVETPLALLAGLALVASGISGCSGPTRAESAESPSVSGTIRGSSVVLTSASFDGALAIHDGSGYGFGPSVLIFLFLPPDEVPAGRSFTLDAEQERERGGPQLHYRWRAAEGGLSSAVAASGYSLQLVFGEIEDGALPGTIALSIPGEDTQLAGAFRAQLPP
jgi:hypothetical protein